MSTYSTKPAVSPAPQNEAPVTANKTAAVSGLRSLVAGGVGGVFAVISGHPFDLVKVRLQTAERGVYTGALDVVRKTAAREGLVRGLYAGVSAPLVGVTPMFAVSFWGYDLGKTIIRRLSPPEGPNPGPMAISQISFAGFFSAIPMTIITAPFERVKVLLQIQGQQGPAATKKYANGLDVIRQLYKAGGVRSIFRGSAATLARDGPGSAAYFATYEVIKRKLSQDGTGRDAGMGSVMIAGGAAGMAMWLLIFPVDTVKSRLQSAEGNPTIASVVRGIYARGGYRAFFPGLGPALARSVPANSMCFLGVELAHKVMNRTFG